MSGPGTRPHAGRAEEDLLVIAQDGERVELAQPADHLVREAVLVDAVAETQQRIDRAHRLEGPIEAIDVAMQVGDDAELQRRPLSPSACRTSKAAPSRYRPIDLIEVVSCVYHLCRERTIAVLDE